MKEKTEKNATYYVKLCAVFLAVVMAVNTVLAVVLIPVALRIAGDAKEALVSVQSVETSITETAGAVVNTLENLDGVIEGLDLDALNSSLSEIDRTMGVLSEAVGALEKVVSALKLLNIFK